MRIIEGQIREVLCSTVHTVVMCADYRGQIREVLCSTVHTVVMCVDYRGADQRGSPGIQSDLTYPHTSV